jgi:hypothetical protein
MKGPGYTVADLVYWMGFILTTGAVNLGLMVILPDWHPLIRLLISIGCGIVAGMAALYVYAAIKNPPRPPQDDRPEDRPPDRR